MSHCLMVRYKLIDSTVEFLKKTYLIQYIWPEIGSGGVVSDIMRIHGKSI